LSSHYFQTSGLSAWIGQQLKDLSYLDPWVLILVLCFIVAGLTELIINAAVVMLMMPILGELVSSFVLIFPVVMYLFSLMDNSVK